jgi:hypothetical protein
MFGVASAENMTGPNWKSKIKGRTGIVVFLRYRTRDGEKSDEASAGMQIIGAERA